MKEEILWEDQHVLEDMLCDKAKELEEDPEYESSIISIGAKVIASIMLVDGVEGFSIESEVMSKEGTTFIINVSKGGN